MKFFASWTTREPLFQCYDSQCCVLVSPSGVPLAWSISKWTSLPNNLFIDSGAFSVRSNKIVSCKDVLERQLFMTKGWPSNRPLYFSHPDILIPVKATFEETNKIVNRSIERAQVYFDLVSKRNTNATPIGVIHGFDEETILNTYETFLDIGYHHFALGSLAIRKTRYKDLCLKTIRLAERYGIKPLHIFGIALPINTAFSMPGIDSFDSASATKLAFYGTVLYGPPLKRYVIAPNAKQKYQDTNFTFRESLSEPLPCKCPVCKLDAEGLIPYSGREAKNNRIIHNYFQIKWAMKKIP